MHPNTEPAKANVDVNEPSSLELAGLRKPTVMWRITKYRNLSQTTESVLFSLADTKFS
jgi:hypothetical protein